MKIPFKDVLGVTMALLITSGSAYAMQPTTVTAEAPKATTVEKVVTPPPTPTAEPLTWQDNPNGCNQDTQYIAEAAPFNCIDKPIAPIAESSQVGGSGSCEAEIAKYAWNVPVAMAVAQAESGMRPWEVNDNPSTGDYSIGCFQVNIYGGNARNRPSEAELKNAAINVAWAYNNYIANGQSFIGQWGVCRDKVACY